MLDLGPSTPLVERIMSATQLPAGTEGVAFNERTTSYIRWSRDRPDVIVFTPNLSIQFLPDPRGGPPFVFAITLNRSGRSILAFDPSEPKDSEREVCRRIDDATDGLVTYGLRATDSYDVLAWLHA